VSKQLFLSYLFSKGKSIMGACVVVVVVVVISSRRAEREKNLFIYQSIFISLSLLKEGSSFYQSIHQSISFAFVDTINPHHQVEADVIQSI
jgi:hypothetical protein